MALRLDNFSGAETGGLEECSLSAGTVGLETTIVYSGDYSYKPAGGSYFGINPSEGQSTVGGNDWILGFRIYFEDNTAFSELAFVRAVENYTQAFSWQIKLTTTGDWKIYDASGTLKATLTAPVGTGTWALVEIRWTCFSSSGNFDLHIDGVSKYSTTGMDLFVGYDFLRYEFMSPVLALACYDDIYMYSGASGVSDFLGNPEVFRYQANTNSATPDVGTALDSGVWQNVGQTPTGTAEIGYTNAAERYGRIFSNDAASGLNYRHGPHGDANITGTKKGGKWGGKLKRGTGAAESWFYLECGSDAPVNYDWQVWLTTAYAWKSHTRDDGYAPDSTRHFSLGIRKGTGDWAIYAQDLWAFILHVPTGAAGRSAIDSVGLDETLSRLTGNYRILSDAAALSDSLSRLLAIRLTETLLVSDALSKSQTLVRLISDSLALVDSLSRLIGNTRTVSDSTRLTDNLLLSRKIGVEDVASLADSLSRLLGRTAKISDATSLVDALLAARSAILADVLRLADALSTGGALQRSASDALALSDIVSRLTAWKIINTLTVQDVTRSARSSSRGEVLALGEILSSSRSLRLAETVLTSDTLFKSQALIKLVSDALALADSLSKLTDRTIWLTDALILADYLGKLLSITVAADDVVSLGDALRAARGAILSDIVRLTETLSVSSTWKSVDSVSLGDAVGRLLGWIKPISDNLVLSDLLSKKSGLGASVTDSLMLIDALLVGRQVLSPETIRLADLSSSGRGLGMLDSITLADIPSRSSGVLRSLSDSLAVADLLRIARTIMLADTLKALEVGLSSGRLTLLADAVALADTIISARGLSRIDNLLVQDSLSRMLGKTATAADALLLADILETARVILLTDSTVLKDATITGGQAERAASDAFLLVESLRSSLSVGISETSVLQDALRAARLLSRSDVLALSDISAVYVGLFRIIQDALSVTDSGIDFARPISDISVGNWTEIPLYQKIDEETPSDADFISSQSAPSNDTCEVLLSSIINVLQDRDHIIRYRYQRT